jgi:hypothetical protein
LKFLKTSTRWCICITRCELLGEAPCLLEELLEVRLAVEDAVHGRIAAHLQATTMHTVLQCISLKFVHGRSNARTYREDPLAVAAFEAGLVVDDAVSREEVDEVDRLVARRALVLRAGERHGGSGGDACPVART